MEVRVVYCSGEHHLGYSRYELAHVSYYHLLHPDCMREVQAKHRLSKSDIFTSFLLILTNLWPVTQSESERACILLLRLQKRSGAWL